jgi:aryl-alcohol dehydrogenase-like predicted oxidoreductase
MNHRSLGNTGLDVSVIGLGTHQFSGEWAKTFSASEVEQMLGRARELGLNLLDTAECYGDHSVEALVGAAIKKRRSEWIVATKFGHRYISSTVKEEAWSAAQVQQQIESSLRALQTDHIDLYQFHSGSNAAFDNDELWTMLDRQVQAGKIRFLGLSLAASVVQKGDLHQLHSAGRAKVRVIQAVYNRLHREAANEVLPYCAEHGLGLLARVPLAKGFLSGAYQPGAAFAKEDIRSTYSADFNDAQLRLVQQIREQEVPAGQDMAQWALAWCLRSTAVSSVIVGCKNLEQLERNAAAAKLVAGQL